VNNIIPLILVDIGLEPRTYGVANCHATNYRTWRSPVHCVKCVVGQCSGLHLWIIESLLILYVKKHTLDLLKFSYGAVFYVERCKHRLSTSNEDRNAELNPGPTACSSATQPTELKMHTVIISQSQSALRSSLLISKLNAEKYYSATLKGGDPWKYRHAKIPTFPSKKNVLPMITHVQL